MDFRFTIKSLIKFTRFRPTSKECTIYNPEIRYTKLINLLNVVIQSPSLFFSLCLDGQ